MRKRILYATLILLVGLVGGVVLTGWTFQAVYTALALTAGYMLGIVVWAETEEKKP